ncbi:MAG: dihydropteroate synthase [Alphaproteobacteria bacterium]
MTARLTLHPLVQVGAVTSTDGSLLAGGLLRFHQCEAVVRDETGERARAVIPVAEAISWAKAYGLAATAKDLLQRLSAPRPLFAGLDMGRPQVMGVINVTPDSFSDGGDRFDPERAIADGLAMRDAGAAIFDVGGESTRPGAAPVSPEEELRRVVPVVAGLARAGALVSIDSRRAEVMAAALEAGAEIVNDITALSGDVESLTLVAERQSPVILMHMQGEPQTMQREPRYDDAPLDVYDFLAARVAACESAGIPRARIAVDPGIGFGKTVTHNLRILDQLAVFHGLGCAVVLGVSRKRFIGRLAGVEAAKDRMPGSLAGALAGVARGVQIVRAHDVAETKQAFAIWTAIEGDA